MKVRELIDYLTTFSPEAEVRIAYQPSWPMWEIVEAAKVGTEEGAPVNAEGVCSYCMNAIDDHDDTECDGRLNGAEIITAEDAPAVYLVGSGTNHYGNAALFS